MLTKRSATTWLTLYVVASALNLLGVFADWGLLANLTKPLLMPLLLAFFLSALDGLRHPLAVWVARALVMSWLGDLFLMGSGQVWFGLGLLCFLGAQICYIVGFRSYFPVGPFPRRPWLILPYVAAGVGLLVLLRGDLGVLMVPVAVYATALVLMAILAAGVAPLTGIGAVLFVVSDSLIALTELSDVLGAGAAVLIMPTYVVAQALIVLGVLQRLGRSHRRREAMSVG